MTTIAVCLLSGACSRSAQEETTEEAADSVETLEVLQATGTAQPDVHGPDSIGPCLDYTKPKHIVWPEYPEGLRQTIQEPIVFVRALVDTHGFVVQAEIVKSLHPLLDELAIEAVKKWEFT
ncbi:MAG: TonB family protein, partial [bacterium]